MDDNVTLRSRCRLYSDSMIEDNTSIFMDVKFKMTCKRVATFFNFSYVSKMLLKADIAWWRVLV